MREFDIDFIMKKNSGPVLTSIKPERIYGSSIQRVAKSPYMVDESARILELADELQVMSKIQAVAVVDSAQKFKGLVSRDNLFAMLGKPYGRDILNKRPVLELSQEVPTFGVHENLFIVAERINLNAETSTNEFYALTDDSGRFRGIFSTQDLLAYLSHITQEDIELAGILQERLIRTHDEIKEESWNFRAWSHYAKGVGGDFYFSRKVSEKQWFFTLCDVSGKGAAASIISSMLWGMLRMYDFRRGLRDLLLTLNESIITTFQMEKYLTGMFFLFDPSNGKLSCADMGHSHVFLFRGGKAIELRAPKPNLPIGIDMSLNPGLYTLQVQPGDTVFVFSDGITEQENPSGEEFGVQRLVESCKTCLAQNRDLTEQLPADIIAFRGSAPQQDDMSFIMLSIPGPETAR